MAARWSGRERLRQSGFLHAEAERQVRCGIQLVLPILEACIRDRPEHRKYEPSCFLGRCVPRRFLVQARGEWSLKEIPEASVSSHKWRPAGSPNFARDGWQQYPLRTDGPPM